MDQRAVFLVRQALQRYATDCRSAQARLTRAVTLHELKQVVDVRPQAIIAHVRSTVPEHRQLAAAAERRAEEICQGHLARLLQLMEQGDRESFDLALRLYRQNDWQLLRGDFPRLVGLVDRKSRALEHQFERPPAERPRG